METLKSSKIAIESKIAQKYGISSEQYKAMQEDIKKETQSATDKAKEQREIAKTEREAEKAKKSEIRGVRISLNNEGRDVLSVAISERKKLSNVINEVQRAAKLIEEKNKKFNEKLKKGQQPKMEILQVTEVLNMNKFSTNLINANFTASQQLSILKGCGNYNLQSVKKSLYTMAAKKEIAVIQGDAQPFVNDYAHGKKFAALIPIYTKKFDELNAKKKHDTKQVKEIVNQYDAKHISEAEKNERLTKYVTKESMAFELQTLLGTLLHELWTFTKPNLTASQFENYMSFYPNLDFLEALVNQKSKKEIENLAKKIEASQPEIESVEI
jgi:hypothetical protein